MTSYPRMRLIHKGTTAEGAQEWSWGLTLAMSSAPANQGDVTTLLEAVRTVLNGSSVGANLMKLAAADCVFSSIAGLWYPAGATSALYLSEIVVGPFAGSGGGELPTQAACCVSLLTGLSGRHNRGRVYLPADGAILNVHQLADGVAASTATRVATYLTGLNTITTVANVVVASATASVPPNVTSVRTDSVVDTQRRRRNKDVPGETANANVT